MAPWHHFVISSAEDTDSNSIPAVCTFTTICQGVAANRRSTRGPCSPLLLTVEKYRPTPPNTLDAAFESVNIWIIQGEINQCEEDVGNRFLKFQLASAGTTKQWQAEFAIVVRSDHEEIMFKMDNKY
ncbi:hypothetical protein D9758_013602 [Tetrapyrgos nigripes]|uniref:Uncharacterized protein n=1 Tax=Tetrapyrgos nigripes TaxID=182062 RepID=A0A8H5CAE4_9AGAR|nr:hypothetical protein D9758_013602 [Tetrapyrgos nigripes]